MITGIFASDRTPACTKLQYKQVIDAHSCIGAVGIEVTVCAQAERYSTGSTAVCHMT